MAGRIAALGVADLTYYLRTAYAGGASLDQLREATGMGRDRLSRALTDAGVTRRAAGATTPAGRRSRAVANDAAAAARVGTDDLGRWLAARRFAADERPAVMPAPPRRLGLRG